MAHDKHAAHGGHAEHGGAPHQPGGGHAGHGEAMFARPFWVSLVLTIPVVVYAELFQDLLGYTPPRFPGSEWLVPVLASIIYWYGGWVFLTGAVAELRRARLGMMTLVALAISTAYFYSLAIPFALVQGMPFYWELATLVSIMLLGHWMELRAVGSAQSALKELAKLLPDTAERVLDERTEEVPVADLRPGDLILVRPGAQVPADGSVEVGRGDVNESMVTGESRPVAKEPGAEVIGGTVNGSGSLRVRVGKTGEETVLAGIMRLVQEAQTSRTRAQALADRAAFWLTLIAVGAATLALVGWTLARGFDLFALERAVTTLVIACPHALGLAIPLVIAISTTLSARNGILVRERTALEAARNLDVVVFDKTGTLTKGEQGLVDVATADGWTTVGRWHWRLAWRQTASTWWRGRSWTPPTSAGCPSRWSSSSKRCPGGGSRRGWTAGCCRWGAPDSSSKKELRCPGRWPIAAGPGASADRQWSTSSSSSAHWQRSRWPT
jgi:Cu2+-exporting ATPase